MKAIVRAITSPDVDLDTYRSEQPEDDGVWIRLIAGPADGPGEESFDVLVCTPLWLRRAVTVDGRQDGRHHLIVDPMNLKLAADYLRRRFEEADAADWPTLAEKLGRLGRWEFEDYRS